MDNMDGTGTYAYNCQLDDGIVIPKNLPERYNGLSSSYSSVIKLKPPCNGDILGVLKSFNHVFATPRRLFLDDDEAMEFLLCILLCRVQIGETFRYAVIDEALGLARLLVNDVTYAGKETLPILGDVVVRTLPRPEESEQEAIARASRECGEATVRDGGMFAPGKGRKELMEAHAMRKSPKAQAEAVGESTQE